MGQDLWLKGSNLGRNEFSRGSFDYAQDRLFDCAPLNALPRDKSVRRFARDDDFAVGLEMLNDRFVPTYRIAEYEL